MPGHSLIGRVATFDSSSVTWPEKPGSMKPAVEWVSRPRRPSEDLPSRRAAMSSGRVMTSYVEPSTNSPGCRMNGSLSSGSTRRVSSGWSSAGSMCGYRWFSKTRNSRSRRRSTLDGWTIAGSNGSSTTRSLSISARMSRSLSSTGRPYRSARGDERDAGHGDRHPGLLHQPQPFLQDDAGEEHGDDREQRRENAGDRDVALRGGDAEGEVGAEVERRDAEDPQVLDPAHAEHRPLPQCDERERDRHRRPHRPQRQDGALVGPAVHEDEEESEADSADRRDHHRTDRGSAGELRPACEDDADDRHDDAARRHRARSLPPDQPDDDGDDRAERRHGRDHAHRPGGEREVVADQPGRAGDSGRDAPPEPAVRAVPLVVEHNADRRQP